MPIQGAFSPVIFALSLPNGIIFSAGISRFSAISWMGFLLAARAISISEGTFVIVSFSAGEAHQSHREIADR